MNLVYDVTAGMRYLYDNKIMHRDIKPDNVLYMMPQKFLISDFGLSAQYKSYDDKLNDACGTPEYLHPDVLAVILGTQKSYAITVDIFSLGVMFFECVTAERPFNSLFQDMRFRCEHLRNQLVEKFEGAISCDGHRYHRYFEANKHNLKSGVITKFTEKFLAKIMDCKKQVTWPNYFDEAENLLSWGNPGISNFNDR